MILRVICPSSFSVVTKTSLDGGGEKARMFKRNFLEGFKLTFPAHPGEGNASVGVFGRDDVEHLKQAFNVTFGVLRNNIRQERLPPCFIIMEVKRDHVIQKVVWLFFAFEGFFVVAGEIQGVIKELGYMFVTRFPPKMHRV